MPFPVPHVLSFLFVNSLTLQCSILFLQHDQYTGCSFVLYYRSLIVRKIYIRPAEKREKELKFSKLLGRITMNFRYAYVTFFNKSVYRQRYVNGQIKEDIKFQLFFGQNEKQTYKLHMYYIKKLFKRSRVIHCLSWENIRDMGEMIKLNKYHIY